MKLIPDHFMINHENLSQQIPVDHILDDLNSIIIKTNHDKHDISLTVASNYFKNTMLFLFSDIYLVIGPLIDHEMLT